MFWIFGREACGILAPEPGMEPTPSALEGEVLTSGPPGKSCNDWTLRNAGQMVFMSDAGLKKKFRWNIAAHLSMPAFAYLYVFLCSYAWDNPSGQEGKGSCLTFFAFFTQENDVNGKEVLLREWALEQVHQLAIAPEKPPINLVARNHYSVLFLFKIYF